MICFNTKNMISHPKQKIGEPIKHKSSKNKSKSKISSKCSSSQRKIVPISKEEEDDSICTTSIRSLERKKAKKRIEKKEKNW